MSLSISLWQLMSAERANWHDCCRTLLVGGRRHRSLLPFHLLLQTLMLVDFLHFTCFYFTNKNYFMCLKYCDIYSQVPAWCRLLIEDNYIVCCCCCISLIGTKSNFARIFLCCLIVHVYLIPRLIACSKLCCDFKWCLSHIFDNCGWH